MAGQRDRAWDKKDRPCVPNVIKIMTLAARAKELTTDQKVVSSLIIGKKSKQNKQVLSSAEIWCIIYLLGYSVEEAYCRLEFDFARV